MTKIQDHFSAQATDYARYRPGYPPELMAFLVWHAHRSLGAKRLAWDCATGNGQAARLLADDMTVHATDISAAQLAQAVPHPRIHYHQASAYDSGLPDHSAQLITVAQAAHWFDMDAFGAEALRVAAPGASLAIWGYGLMETKQPALDAVIRDFYTGIVGPFWEPARRHIDEQYSGLHLPVTLRPAPMFFITQKWTLDALIGYLRTWSSVQAYQKAHGHDPVAQIQPALASAWPCAHTQAVCVRWDIFLKWGKCA